MKKNLLISIFLSSVYFVSAQQTGSNHIDHTSSVCNVLTMGLAPNAFGSAGGTNTVLWYDKDINSITFIHRAGCDGNIITNTGFFNYDISTNGGATWSLNRDPVYGPQSNPGGSCVGNTGPHPGRYPKGGIYNPSGNTDTLNAHLSYTGYWNSTGAPIEGKVNGTGHLNGTPPNENYDSTTWGNAIYPEDIFISKAGTSCIVGQVRDQLNFLYKDSIAILMGTWNGSDFVYDYNTVYYPVNPDVGIWDMKVAFSDNGLTGYLAILTNQDPGHTHFVNSSSYIQVLKTIDGGQTWSCPVDLDVQTALDSALINHGTDYYETGFELDIVIDMNDNLHMITLIRKFTSLSRSYKEYGMFDFYTLNGGNTYLGQLIAHPQTEYGVFGTVGVDAIIEYHRPFASRNWDGSKIIFGFFDTDTATFGIYTNENPDLRLIGYDVVNNLWTADLSNLQLVNGGENITTGSNAEGACTFGNGPYYFIDNGGTISVPVNYMVVGNSGVNTSLPCDFFYIDCAAPTGTFSFPGHPLSVPVLHLSSLCDSGSGVVLSTNELTSDLIVSANYPNPFRGKTSVDVTIAKAGDVSIDITNIVGQKLITTNYLNLHSGQNAITIDATSLVSGLYFFTVKAGCNSITQTMKID